MDLFLNSSKSCHYIQKSYKFKTSVTTYTVKVNVLLTMFSGNTSFHASAFLFLWFLHVIH